jgi:signal transduction histidine kinase
LQHAEDIPAHPEDSRLMAFLGCEALLAVPMPVTDSERGILIAGLSQEKLQKLLPTPDSLRLLAAHCGARLQLEQIKRNRVADLARKELEAIEKVALSIAHEISNPLAIIQNFLVALERKIAKGIDTSHDIQLISDEIERISAIARQLENISDFTSRKPTKTSRLDHLLKDVLVFFRESVFHNRNIEIAIKLQADTRSLPVPVDTMRQVLTILFNNAAEAIHYSGKIVISSTLEKNASGNRDEVMLKITVTDSGPGVNAELVSVIFDAGITTKQEGHLGLGLSIARKLLLDRGGNIRYEQTPGSGSSFSIFLPVD